MYKSLSIALVTLGLVAFAAASNAHASIRTLKASCGERCGSYTKCTDGFECVKGKCIKHISYSGGKCDDKCLTCAGKLECVSDGKNGKKCALPKPSPKPSPAKCGESCDSAKKCAKGLQCNKKKICQRVRNNVGDVCTKKCQVCKGELKCTSDGKGKKTCQFPPRNCGQSCDSTKKCGDGLHCSKDKKCQRTVDKVGDSCEKSCHVCKVGLRCVKGSKGKSCQTRY